MKQLALEISTNPPTGSAVNALDIALLIAEQTPERTKSSGRQWAIRWLSNWKFATAQRAYEHAGDVGALYLLGLAMGDTSAVKEVGRHLTLIVH